MAKDMKEIELTLVGFVYHCEQSYIDSIEVGDTFRLQREEDNEHDPLAIGVYDGDKLVGYVRAYETFKIWSALMNPVMCTITKKVNSYFGATVTLDVDKIVREDRIMKPMEDIDMDDVNAPALVELAQTARSLAKFVNSLLQNDETRNTLESHLHNMSDEPYPIEKTLKMFLLADMYIIYDNLGHRFDKCKPESFGAIILAYLYDDPDAIVDLTFGWKPWVENMESTVGDAVRMAELNIFESVDQDYTFYLQTVLATMEDKQWTTRYKILMFRFATLVAQIDHKIIRKEAVWLASIMRLPGTPMQGDIENFYDIYEANMRGSDAIDKLMSLVGLKDVKEEIKRLRSFIQIQKLRKEEGLTTIPVAHHFVFTGNPGTGKTTVARILADIYGDLGVVKSGHLVETDRSGLVAEYVGQTAIKTNQIIDDALDGILFIDEAYTLVREDKEDFGSEAIATLLKRMEDERERLVVILAGYVDEMKHFIDSNPGLQSRFTRYIHFPDYTPDELMEIFEKLLAKNEFVMTDEARALAYAKFVNVIASQTKHFGNGRYVRNVFEKMLETQAVRLFEMPNVTRKDLQTIESSDLC